MCTGTATEIGKTWFGAATLSALRQNGVIVAARKPVQSFDPADPHPTDAAVLAEASGEDVTTVSPPNRSLGVAMAPPMAAEVLGLPPVRLADLIDEIAVSWTPGIDLGWVEAVGGVRAPIADDGDCRDLAAALGADDIVLVADAALGTLNSVRLSVESLAPLGVPIVVAINRFDPSDDLHRRNHEWLTARDGLDVCTSPDQLAGHFTKR